MSNVKAFQSAFQSLISELAKGKIGAGAVAARIASLAAAAPDAGADAGAEPEAGASSEVPAGAAAAPRKTRREDAAPRAAPPLADGGARRKAAPPRHGRARKAAAPPDAAPGSEPGPLMRAAALSGAFLPEDLRPLGGARADPAEEIALRSACAAVSAGGEIRLILPPDRRMAVLAALRDAGTLAQAVRAARRRREADPERDPLGRELLAFLSSHPPVARKAAAPEFPADDDRLARRLEVAEWFETADGGWPDSMSTESEALRIEAARRAERASLEALAEGFRGRRSDQLKLAGFLRRRVAVNAPPPPILAVTGGPGSGKSALLAKFALNLAERPRAEDWAVIRMDLDDPALQSADISAMSFELTRQLGHARPALEADLSALRRDARAELGAFVFADAAQRTLGRAAAYRVCGRLMRALSDALTACGAAGANSPPVLLLLDSLDAALRGSAPSEQDLRAGRELRRWLTDLTEAAGLERLRVVMFGAGLDHAAEPPLLAAEVMRLAPLDAEDAAAVIREEAQLPEAKVRELVAQLPGRADALRLGARLAAGVAARAKNAGPDGAPDAAAPEVPDGPAAAYDLQIVSLPGRELRALAALAPALRRVWPGVLRSALAPAAGLGMPDDARAAELCARLADEDWLIAGPAPGGGLALRRDLRRLALPVLEADPARAERMRMIHESAMALYEAGPEEIAPEDAEAEALYHRLMARPLDAETRAALRRGSGRLIRDADDLPDPARAALLLAAGRPMSNRLARALTGRNRARFLDARGWELVNEDRPGDALELLADGERAAPAIARGWIGQARLDLGDWDPAADADEVREADLAAMRGAEPPMLFREGAPLVRRLILGGAPEAPERALELLRRLLDQPEARFASPAARARLTGALRLALVARGGAPIPTDGPEKALVSAALAVSNLARPGSDGASSAAVVEAGQTLLLLIAAGAQGLLHPLHARAYAEPDGPPALRAALAPGQFSPDPAWISGVGAMGGPVDWKRLKQDPAPETGELLGPIARRWARRARGAPIVIDAAALNPGQAHALLRASSPELHAPARHAMAAATPDRAAYAALADAMAPRWPVAPADLAPSVFAAAAARAPLRGLSAMVEYADRSNMLPQLLEEAARQADARGARGPAAALRKTLAALERWSAPFGPPDRPASDPLSAPTQGASERYLT
ncbi:AAA family ATPase [Oceanicella actignis]|uniref:AAA family ATPase n=1 Tax=Oceanicella actignis TaxID=1189325 RepID=UPI0012576E79|nr:AAA family ATPase [Oceanicella actignis]TYO90902.1 AAA ATPase-like protein [Oceanicella actignis]